MRAVVAACLLALAVAAAPARAEPETPPKPRGQRPVVGFIERVRLFPGDFLVHAKIDTGARTSSLNAQDIVHFARGGERWVRFSVTNRENETATFERRVVRHARIKDLTGPAQSRVVVSLGLCVGTVFRMTEVNLTDRSGFNYQLLVGRRFLRQRLVVDPARRYTAAPACGAETAERAARERR